ncbi:MAG: hypothetical protein Q9M92_15670 [Enterobacterales bacterium]|nr:hypothetical protein [Enterobacterales bacterium]
MLKLADFFGLKLDPERSDISSFLEAVNVDNMINNTNVVKKIAASNGRDSPIVGVARRQQFLKLIKPLLNETMLDYDAHYYIKEVNTSSDHDRRYCAEDKLIQVALIIASTKSIKTLESEPNIPGVRQLREAAFLGSRFDRLWDVLTEETSHVIKAFRKGKK